LLISRRPAKDKLQKFDQELLYLADPVIRVNETFNLGFKLDPIQEQIIRDQSPRIIVNCSRQWGKTTTVAAKAAAEAVSEKGLYLVIAPTERQAKELFRRCLDYTAAAFPDMQYEERNKTSMELANGSRIIALPAKGENIRGYPNPTLVIIDEAAFVKDEDYRACRPFLSHGGKLILLSTPFGKRGFFYEIWRSQDKRWHRYTVAATDCHHITKEFLDEERVAIGPWWYQQEYECQFLDNISGYFDMDAVRDALENNISPLFAQSKDGEGDCITDELKPLFPEVEN